MRSVKSVCRQLVCSGDVSFDYSCQRAQSMLIVVVRLQCGPSCSGTALPRDCFEAGVRDQGKVTTTLLGVAWVTAGSMHVAEFMALQSPVQLANGGDPVDEAVLSVIMLELAL